MRSKTSESSAGASTQRKKLVFIVEDHPVFREGLVQVLSREEDLAVCGQAKSAEEALEALSELRPHLLLVDISLPGKSGLDLIKELRKSSNDVKVLVISMHDEALYADRVLRAGADGYIMKQEDPDEIVHAVRDVLDGHIYVSEAVLGQTPKVAAGAPTQMPKPRLDLLSDEQVHLLELLGHGKTEEEIARKTGARLGVVRNSCADMRRKLKLKTANQLIRFAVCWVESAQ